MKSADRPSCCAFWLPFAILGGAARRADEIVAHDRRELPLRLRHASNPRRATLPRDAHHRVVPRVHRALRRLAYLLRPPVLRACDRWYNTPDAALHDVSGRKRAGARGGSGGQQPDDDGSAAAPASHAPRIVDKSARSRIKLSDLRAILSLEAADDGQSALVRAEPGVTIAEITRYLISKGFILQCTLEMENATLGGIANGTGVTTQSHRAGVFHDIIVSWEVVAVSGALVVATATNEHADLFRALPFSHGSLGPCVAPRRAASRRSGTFTLRTRHLTRSARCCGGLPAEDDGRGAARFCGGLDPLADQRHADARRAARRPRRRAAQPAGAVVEAVVLLACGAVPRRRTRRASAATRAPRKCTR